MCYTLLSVNKTKTNKRVLIIQIPIGYTRVSAQQILRKQGRVIMKKPTLTELHQGQTISEEDAFFFFFSLLDPLKRIE